MNKKEMLILSIGIFLTAIAYMINLIYHIQNEKFINREIPPPGVPKITIDTSIFPVLKERSE